MFVVWLKILSFLQEEETVWTDYTADEVFVKNQMSDTILDLLVDDTVNVFDKIYRKRNNVT